MSELAAVRAMLSKDLFVKFSPVLLDVKNLMPEHKQILSTIGEYFKRYQDKEDLTVDELRAFFSVANPAGHKASTSEILNRMESLDLPNEELIRDILSHFVELHMQSQLVALGTEMMNGSRATAYLEEEKLIEAHKELVQSLVVNRKQRGYREHIRDIRQRNKAGALRWALQWMNTGLGPVRPGTLGHIFARPNAGKTSFAIFNAAYWAYQWQQKEQPGEVLYLQNEEHPGEIRKRMMQCALGLTEAQIDSDYDKVEKKYLDKIGDRIIIEANADHMRSIVQHIEESECPRVVILDQGPTVAIPGGSDLTGPDRLRAV